MLTVEPCVPPDLSQLTINFDRRYALGIQELYHRTHFTVGGCWENRCNDSTVKTRKVPLVHASFIYHVHAFASRNK